MRCSRKSTRWFARPGAAAGLAFACLLARTAAAATDPTTATGPVARAIVSAVEARMGQQAHARVTRLEGVRLAVAGAPIVATPDPSGRVGQLVRFRLSATSLDGGRPGAPLGEAFAVVAVTRPVVRMRHDVANGRVVAADDVEATSIDLGDVPFRALPTLTEVVGGRALRDLGPGDVVTDLAVAAVPAVRAGDAVRIVARIAGVEAVATGVAVETGRAGQIVRVTNPSSRRQMRARVVGAGEVEVIDE